MYTIKFSDGTVLDNLTLNGNNFISTQELTEADFEGKLNRVIIDDGESEEVHNDMELIQIATYPFMPGQWFFILRDIPREELERRLLRKQLAAIEDALCELDQEREG